MKTFRITKAHLKLLQHMYIGWSYCEFGAPEIDPKRPYGNSSVELDIAEILEWTIADELDEQQYDLANELHKETQTALQICLATNLLRLGYMNNMKNITAQHGEK